MLSAPVTQDQLHALINNHLSDTEALALLSRMTPDRVSAEQMGLLLQVLEATRSVLFPPLNRPVIDCCGTGGSGFPHYNTSSTVAFVLAAAGVGVAKFGNRAITSQSGSFDFLERIGIPAQVPIEATADLFDATGGLIFLFAPQWYPALGALKRLRQQIATPTVFNVIGPLLNPAKPAFRLMGVMDATAQKRVAETISRDTSTRRAWIVRCQGESPFGCDELAVTGASEVYRIEAGALKVEPTWMPPLRANANTTPNGSYDAAFNAQLFTEIVEGRDDVSAVYHHVCLNAGVALMLAEQADTVEEGITLARDLLAEGAVNQTWTTCRRAYARYAG